MIRLYRPNIPQELAASRIAALKQLWDDWKAGKPLKIRASIYAHPAVKGALKSAQSNKCAYCETLNPTSHDVVEHYRPKGGWRQKREHPLKSPEYFWLSYDWDNLLFACDMCNDRGHKENLFPLANPKSRATVSAPDVTAEKPLLLDPYVDDPFNYIDWSADIPKPRKRSRRGRATIDICGLDRDGPLMDARRNYLHELDVILAAAEELPRNNLKRIAVRPIFRAQIEDSSPWAAMVRTNLGSRIQSF